MAQFRYKAVTAAGDTIDGEMEAATREEVIARLQDAGNLPLDAREAAAGGGTSLRGLFVRAEMSALEINQFTQQLAVLLGAGQPLDRALQILLDLPDSERARKLIERVRDAVRGGLPLSTALEQQHGVFSRLYVNMVRAGEVSGSLHDTLTRLADYLDRSAKLKSSVINAMIYPLIIIVAVIGALALLMIYVVPQFVPIFADLGAELPLPTRLVLGLSTFAQQTWWVIVAAGCLGVLWLRRRLRDPETRRVVHERLLGLGLVGQLVQKIETARLARTLGTLVRNGVPLLTALSIGRNITGNVVLAEALERAAEDVKTGSGLAYALGSTKRFPRLALQMIAVGEESGELDGMLMRVADTFDTEVKNTIDRLLAALVPAVVIVLAAAVAFIMIAILLPMMDMTSALG